jgi:hypothetical protein
LSPSNTIGKLPGIVPISSRLISRGVGKGVRHWLSVLLSNRTVRKLGRSLFLLGYLVKFGVILVVERNTLFLQELPEEDGQ